MPNVIEPATAAATTATAPMAVCRRPACAHAGAPQPASAFYANAARPNGLSDYCRVCTRAYAAERRARVAAAVNVVTHGASPAGAAFIAAVTPEMIATTMRGLRFGVEIECAEIRQGDAMAAVAAAVGDGAVTYGASCSMPDGRTWSAVHDGSIRPWGTEVVTPILTWEDMPLLQRVIRELRRRGAKANVSCGLHVHVGCESLDARMLAGLASVVYENQDALYQALAIHSNREHYCKRLNEARVAEMVRATNRDALNRAWYGSRTVTRAAKMDGSRYHCLNLNSFFYRGTAEFRWANGTMHAGKVKSAVHLALALTAYARHGGRSEVRSAGRGRSVVVALLDRIGLVGDEFATARHHLLAAFDEGDDADAARADAGPTTADGAHGVRF